MKRVIVTGGAGFIGSAFIWKLNKEGIEDILVVDALGASEKWKNLVNLRFTEYLHKSDFIQQIRQNTVAFAADTIVHLGACSSPAERNADYLIANNYCYTRDLAEWAVARNIRFLYASSAATYGDGANGFSDEDNVSLMLRPLNMYGYSKSLFDLHALRSGLADKIVGIKFFNVFGPNEYHKGEMTSMALKAFHQIQDTGRIQLFQSNHPDYEDGEQKRDFVYVKDCVEVLWWLLEHHEITGIFNLGTGQARSWNALTQAVFAALKQEPAIDYIPMPDTLQGKYQYFTEANLDKLRRAGCPVTFHSLEEAIRDYVANYLYMDGCCLSSSA